MRALVENLYAVQQLQLNSPASTERDAKIQKLRESIPGPVLTHFDRLLSVGRRGVSVVRNGICRECHLRVPSGIAASLASPKDLYICDNCGGYLFIPLEELNAAAAAAPTAHSTPPVAEPKRKVRRKSVATTA